MRASGRCSGHQSECVADRLLEFGDEAGFEPRAETQALHVGDELRNQGDRVAEKLIYVGRARLVARVIVITSPDEGRVPAERDGEPE